MKESQIQRAVFDQLKARAWPNAVFWHVPNDRGSRTKSGFRAGVSDVHVLHRGKFYAIELKTEDGTASDAQLEFIDDINHAEGHAFVAEGLDQAVCCLELWGILRRSA